MVLYKWVSEKERRRKNLNYYTELQENMKKNTKFRSFLSTTDFLSIVFSNDKKKDVIHIDVNCSINKYMDIGR